MKNNLVKNAFINPDFNVRYDVYRGEKLPGNQKVEIRTGTHRDGTPETHMGHPDEYAFGYFTVLPTDGTPSHTSLGFVANKFPRGENGETLLKDHLQLEEVNQFLNPGEMYTYQSLRGYENAENVLDYLKGEKDGKPVRGFWINPANGQVIDVNYDVMPGPMVEQASAFIHDGVTYLNNGLSEKVDADPTRQVYIRNGERIFAQYVPSILSYADHYNFTVPYTKGSVADRYTLVKVEDGVYRLDVDSRTPMMSLPSYIPEVGERLRVLLPAGKNPQSYLATHGYTTRAEFRAEAVGDNYHVYFPRDGKNVPLAQIVDADPGEVALPIYRRRRSKAIKQKLSMDCK